MECPVIRVKRSSLCALAHRLPQRVKGTSELRKGNPMSNIVYIVGLIVVVIAVASFFGLR